MALSQAQKNIGNDTHRFRVAICGRRFGKTHLAIRELAKFARIPGKRCFYVAPTYRQAKQIVWDKLKYRLQDLRWVDKVNESDLTITLVNGSKISLRGADNPDSLRGVGLDFIVLDEFAMIDPKAWYEVLRPTLSDQSGHAMFISTPMGTGNWAKDLFDLALDSEDWASWQYTTLDGGRVPEDEVEAAKRDMDERTFRQEYLATFESFAGRIYYAFDRANIVKFTVDTPEVIYIGMDFNIDPMSATIGVRLGDNMHIIDEIRMFSSNTQEMVQEIKNRYPKSKIWVYPDPASRQRKTSAGGHTDLSILQNAGFVVKAPNAHDPVRDGINAVNSRLCGADGVRRLLIDPKCKYTIEALERHAYKEGTSQPDKDSGYDHMSDALRYMISYIWPLKRDVKPQPAQRWTHRTA
jgi:phage terminase large subunit